MTVPGDRAVRSAFGPTPWYGGDYNPEQWPTSVWDEDVALMKQAGVTMVTLGVFSWALLEPREGEYDFSWLDDVISRLSAAGIAIDLATGTASPPPWLSTRYPESLPVTADGVRLSHGSRQAYCPSSPAYRSAAARLVRAMAERYSDEPALALWHVGNEYGCHVSRCCCETSAQRFREWLARRYGSVAALNAAWGTAFWSQHYDAFDEIVPPRATPALLNPALQLDFDRFSSDELLDCYLAEKRILREVTPTVAVTTNFMGTFRGLDYWTWAEHLDVISDDLYPDPADPDGALTATMARDLMRSLGKGRPWLLMEQATSAVNFRPHNAPKAPGQMRALSYQALARGADGILFFQWRQSAAGAERFHSAMLPHSGCDTRVWREVTQLGRELSRLPDPMGTAAVARAAVVLDWDSWWAIEQRGQASQTSYLDLVAPWHAALTRKGVLVDFTRGEDDLSRYDLVVAPGMYVASDSQLAALAAAAAAGSTVVVTSQSALVDETLRVRLGGYLGGLQETLGLWVEELVPLTGAWARPGAAPVRPTATQDPVLDVVGSDLPDGHGTAHGWADHVRVVDAEVRATFQGGALDGLPAVTRRAAGRGSAWYVATRLDAGSLDALASRLIDEAGIDLPVACVEQPSGWVEDVTRGQLRFVVNHSQGAVTLTASGTDLLSGAPAHGLVLPPQGVAVVS